MSSVRTYSMGCCQIAMELQAQEVESPPRNGIKPNRLSAISFRSSNFVSRQHTSLLSVYDLEKVLGQGAFGKVYLATSRSSGLRRAIKALDKTALTAESAGRVQREIEILMELDHPNIVRIYEVIEDERYINIVQELCEGGELFDRIIREKRFSEDVAARYMTQILSAVTHCHKLRIVHRDLKPENILFESLEDQSALRVIDFGISRKHFSESPLRKKYGTVWTPQAYYMAPEVLRGNYDEKCDVWSCGVLLYILLSTLQSGGYPPFNGNSQQEIIEKVKIGVYSMTSNAKELIAAMLTFAPDKRISAEEAFKHPWLHRCSEAPLNPIEEKLYLANLGKFFAVQKFKQAALTYIASQLLSSSEISSLRQIFYELDTDGDGRLSRDELIFGYNRSALTLVNIDKIIRSCDSDKNGFIDYTEFLAAAMNWDNLLSREIVENAFKVFDRDGNGSISKDELKSILKGEESLGDEVWEALIKQADKNGDGVVIPTQIDLDEFKHLMLTHQSTSEVGV